MTSFEKTVCKRLAVSIHYGLGDGFGNISQVDHLPFYKSN